MSNLEPEQVKQAESAPSSPENQPYVKGAGAKLTIVPADTENFQINFDAFEAALNPNVQVVLINTPNNPTGVIYSEETLQKIAAILEKKQKNYCILLMKVPLPSRR